MLAGHAACRVISKETPFSHCLPNRGAGGGRPNFVGGASPPPIETGPGIPALKSTKAPKIFLLKPLLEVNKMIHVPGGES